MGIVTSMLQHLVEGSFLVKHFSECTLRNENKSSEGKNMFLSPRRFSVQPVLHFGIVSRIGCFEFELVDSSMETFCCTLISVLVPVQKRFVPQYWAQQKTINLVQILYRLVYLTSLNYGIVSISELNKRCAAVLTSWFWKTFWGQILKELLQSNWRGPNGLQALWDDYK